MSGGHHQGAQGGGSSSDKPTSPFSDLVKILGFAGSQAAVFGIAVYITGFIFLQNVYDQLSVPIKGYDLPANVLYAHALSVYGRHGFAVMTFLFVVAGIYFAVAILARSKVLNDDVYRLTLILITTLATAAALLTSYRWANAAAIAEVVSVRQSDGATRVGFILTKKAKQKYDRRFIEASTRVDLRLVYEAQDVIYAIRRTAGPEKGQWRYFTYGVPRGDIIVMIRRD